MPPTPTVELAAGVAMPESLQFPLASNETKSPLVRVPVVEQSDVPVPEIGTSTETLFVLCWTVALRKLVAAAGVVPFRFGLVMVEPPLTEKFEPPLPPELMSPK
jgi:hypothetical protein